LEYDVVRGFNSRILAALISSVLAVASLTAAVPATAASSSGASVASAPDASPVVTTDITGAITTIPDGKPTPSSARTPFIVDGQGILAIDFSAAKPGALITGSFSVTVAVPEGLDLGTSDGSKFAALSHYSFSERALTAVSVKRLPGTRQRSIGTQGMVNTEPVVPATQKIFAVAVTPADVPGSGVTDSQSEGNIQADVAASSAYWMSQSSNKVGFTLVGVTSWYQSAINCNVSDESNAEALWDEARLAASTELGFRGLENEHLALFFPSGYNCGGAIGLGTVGITVNSGGYLWVIGSETPKEKHSLAHELGHNLSLGHSNFLDCAGAIDVQPLGLPGTCPDYEYGDAADVMGYGMSTSSGGSLSSPQAIRSGLWGNTSYSIAPQGTTTYTLNSLNSGAGKRAVIVEDELGTNFFVEYRTVTGIDADYATFGCVEASGACAASTAGVRVLVLEQPDVDVWYDPFTTFYKGVWGDGSRLISRTESSQLRANYTQGQSFSYNGILVTIGAVTSTTAKVTVRRPHVSSLGWGVEPYVDVFKTQGSNGSTYRVGDTLTGMLDGYWIADSYTFQWYRNGTKISGATKQSYILTSSDYGKYPWVLVKSTTKDSPSILEGSDSEYLGPVEHGDLITGTISINANSLPFVANAQGWATTGTKLAFQWKRDGISISGATHSTYTPTSSDYGHALSVRLTASKSGYNALSPVLSVAKDYSIIATGSASISGTAQVGQVLSSSAVTYSSDLDGPLTPTLTHKWYRSGVLISGATGATYPLVAADYGKKITYKETATQSGYTPITLTSPATASVVKGTIQGSLAIPVVTKNSGTMVLTAALPGGSVTESGVATAYQWYRGTTAITGATHATFTLSATDYNKALEVRVTLTKLNFTTVTLYSVPVNYSLIPDQLSPTFSGAVAVGQTLTVDAQTFTTEAGPATPDSITYQWYRDGVAIGLATNATYTPASPADLGKTLRVKVVATLVGFLQSITTSASTQKVGQFSMAGYDQPVVVSNSGTPVVLSTTGGVTEGGITETHQWYRNGVAISGATSASYSPTSSDYGKSLKVKFTWTKPNFTTVVTYSDSKDYSVTAVGTLGIIGMQRVGSVLSINDLAYSTVDGSVASPIRTYQWYRNGVAIPTATFAAYTTDATDYGKKITVKVTGASDGYLSHNATSPATATLVKGEFAGSQDVPTIAGTAPNLTSSLPSGSITGTTFATAYQWYRDGVAISGASGANYTMISADNGHLIKVRYSITKTNYTTVTLYSLESTYSF
jgi:hypothetical protein